MKSYEVQLDRHEAKYIIPPSYVPQIREFIAPFCHPDKYGRGDPPEYNITTLQLDTPSLSFYHAKEWEVVNRFKLRIRTYGDDSPLVFLEVKRKFGGCISKLRAGIPKDVWCVDVITKPGKMPLTFWSKSQETAYLEFVRLVQMTGASPVMRIRYTREAHFGKNDHYARVSFDRALMYQPTRSWELSGEGQRWYRMDCSLAQNKEYRFSGVILELKTLSDAPQWMLDVVSEFGLVRTGNCKYATGIAQESLFRGRPAPPGWASELFSYL